MGNNCVHVMSYEAIKEKVRVVSYNGEVLEFKGSTPVNKIITSVGAYIGHNLVHHSQPFSPLSPKTKLEAGEIYYLVPDLVLKVLTSPKVGDDHGQDQGCNKRQKVKIVVTREQLEFLLKCQRKDFALGFEEGSSPKWRPALTSIAEVKDF